jgi:protein-tyrosine-phosphatase/DNA-binding HxlR family transcriptional regulator
MNLERYAEQAQVHAALADPHRLAIIEVLNLSDRTPREVEAMLGVESNLLAHHLAVLEAAGLIERVTSQGDRRRRYVRLTPSAHHTIHPPTEIIARRIIFVCSENAGRSQLAQAIWNQTQRPQAISAGTGPAKRLYPGAIRAAARRGIDLRNVVPSQLPELRPGDLIITVCDRAHEIVAAQIASNQLHWSVPDPAADPDPKAFERSAEAISARITIAGPHIQPPIS